MRTLLVISLLIGGIAVAMPSLFTSYMGRTARHASVQAAVPEASDETSATPRHRRTTDRGRSRYGRSATATSTSTPTSTFAPSA